MKVDKNALMFIANHLNREPVTVKGFESGALFAREATALEAQSHFRNMKASKTEQQEVDAIAKLVVKVLCDEDGAPVLSEDDLPVVRTWPARLLRHINEASSKAGEVEEDEKDEKEEGEGNE